MLVPAITLVLIALAAVAIDLVLVHSGQRAAYRAASGAVDDAAGMIDHRLVQLTGDVRIDRDAARAVIEARLRGPAADLPGRVTGLEIDFPEFPGGTVVTVHLELAVPHVFLGSVPGIDDVAASVDVRGRLDA